MGTAAQKLYGASSLLHLIVSDSCLARSPYASLTISILTALQRCVLHSLEDTQLCAAGTRVDLAFGQGAGERLARQQSCAGCGFLGRRGVGPEDPFDDAILKRVVGDDTQPRPRAERGDGRSEAL